MKKIDQAIATHARVYAITASTLLATIIIWFTFYMIPPSWIATLSIMERIMFLITAFLFFKVGFLFLAKSYNLGAKIERYLKMSYSKKLGELRERRDYLKERKKELVQEYREAYAPKSIFSTNTPFVFKLLFYQNVDPNCLPVVKMNGKPVGISIATTSAVFCYTKKVISAADEKLVFSIGGDALTMENPFFMARDVHEPIRWQCEGHTSERKIIVPRNYFPHATDGVKYSFSLKIDKRFINTFIGFYDEKLEAIIIPLGKEVSKNNCASKGVTITPTYDAALKLTLPNPIVLERNGKLVN